MSFRGYCVTFIATRPARLGLLVFLDMGNKCPICNEIQWSIADRNYVKLFGTCWSEDKQKWQDGKLSLEEFEKREKLATQNDL